MPAVMNVTAWMNMPSPYQSRFFAALAAQPDVRVRVIYAYGISEDREALGWKRVDEGATYEIVMLKAPSWLHACRLAWQRRHDFQMVNSLWAVPVFTPVRLLHALVGSRPLLIHSEASDPTLPRTWLRTAIRNAFGRAAALTRRFGVLAISPLAERQYRRLGFESARVYPFGYFNEATRAGYSHRSSRGRQLVFVGQLIRRKGWHVLFDALRPLWSEFPDLTLDIIGTGADEPAMRQSIASVPEARVSFRGSLDAAAVPDQLRQYDLLVLPSSFDGWGLVVNEALMVGVPALVSTGCGAACLIEEGANGFRVPPRDVEALRATLRRFLLLDAPAQELMREASLRSARGISLELAAQYLVECFRHAAGLTPVKPAAPWLTSSGTSAECS